MPTAAVDEPRFFLDRGLGSQIVPTALRARGWSLTTMDERYGADRSQAVGDEEWISDAADRGEILLCKDRAVARNVAEARAIYMHDARVFALARADLTGPAMAAVPGRGATPSPDGRSRPRPAGSQLRTCSRPRRSAPVLQNWARRGQS